MLHFTFDQPDRRLRHYWILSGASISMYNEYNDGVNPTRVYKRIALGEILSLSPYSGQAVDSRYESLRLDNNSQFTDIHHIVSKLKQQQRSTVLAKTWMH